MKRLAVAFAVVWLCFVTIGAARALTFPALSGRVVDEAQLLMPAERASLTASLADLEAKTTDQFVIVTLKSLQGTTIEDYGYQLGRHWQIGQKDKNSGVLLIVAAAERKVRIEVGYGLEGTLTDALTKVIIENAIVPAFRSGNFAGGIKSGTDEIIRILRKEAGTLPVTANRGMAPTGPDAPMPVWLVIVLGVGAVALLIFCAVSGGSACRAIMQVLLIAAMSGRGGSSRGGSKPFSGRGGSFGGGGSSGSW
jgi:uncharacterized protein